MSWLQSIPFRVDNDKELLAILLLGKTFSNPYLDNYAKGLEIEKWFRCYSEIVGQRGDWDILLASQIIRGRPTDLNTVRELLGHKTVEMTLRYSHLSPDHKKKAVDVLGRELSKNQVKSVPDTSPESIESETYKTEHVVTV